MSDTLEESLPAHAPLGPSSAEGWATCADYVNANRGLPDFTTEPAAEGTAAHSISELCLLLGVDAEDFIGVKTEVAGFTFVWDDEDAMLMQPGIDRVRADAADLDHFYGEQRVDISRWTLPGQFGTLDRAYIVYDRENDTWWVVIEDLKWGRGIAVSPVDNKQIMLYALAFWFAVARHVIPDGVAPRFRLLIDQPRNAGGGGAWHTTLDELLAFGEWIKERAALTAQPDAPRTASLRGCMWCRRRRAPGGCNAFDNYMVDLLGLTWDDIDTGILMGTKPELPRDLDPHRRSWLLLHSDSIKRWLDALQEEALADAQAGRPTGIQKAVFGNRPADQWKDKGADAKPVVERLLGEDGFTKRLKSVKAITTALEGDADAQAAIVSFIKPGERKPILAPLEDARTAIVTAANFEEVEGTN